MSWQIHSLKSESNKHVTLSKRVHQQFSRACLLGTLVISVALSLLLICNMWICDFPEKYTATVVDYELQHEYPPNSSSVVLRYIPVLEFEFEDGSICTAKGVKIWSKEEYAVGASVAVRYNKATPEFAKVVPAYGTIVNILLYTTMAAGAFLIGKSFRIVTKATSSGCDVVAEANEILRNFESKKQLDA